MKGVSSDDSSLDDSSSVPWPKRVLVFLSLFGSVVFLITLLGIVEARGWGAFWGNRAFVWRCLGSCIAAPLIGALPLFGPWFISLPVCFVVLFMTISYLAWPSWWTAILSWLGMFVPAFTLFSRWEL